jgi:hypothetical protein
MEHPGTITLRVREKAGIEMAKVKLPSWITEIRGKMGDVVFRTSPSGETYISKKPDMSRVEWSPAQKEQRRRMKRAIAYAKAAMADPDVRAVYEQQAAEQNRQPFRVAVSDYLKGNDLLSGK